MFNVCPGCGQYSEEKAIDPAGPFAVCSYCDYRHPFVRLPLFVISGAIGAGKTTVCLELAPRVPECVCLESDILWRPEFATPEDDYHEYRNLWLRVAKNIGQSGRPVVLVGTAIPEQFETCVERRYFTRIHYLALVCDQAQLAARLRSRPGWRRSSSPEFIQEMQGFNWWLKANAHATDPPMAILDTTELSIQEAVEHTREWIRRCLR